MTEDQLRQLLNVLEAGVLTFESEELAHLTVHELKARLAIVEARRQILLQLEQQAASRHLAVR